MRTVWFGGTTLTVLALSCAATADEASAVAVLKKVGATVLYEGNDPKKPVRSIYLPGKKVTDAHLKHLKELKKLEFVRLDAAPNITDEGVKELASLEQLKDVGLGSTKVTDAGVKHLTKLKNLTNLNLNFTKVTDASVNELAKLEKLTTLGVQFTQMTPEGITKLQAALPKCKIHR
jgi:hypothetical protein